MPRQLQFAPFSSALDGGFWHKLSQLKLDVFGLDDKPQDISGFYFNGNLPGIPCQLNLEFTAFDKPAKVPPRHFPTTGILKNTNTIDDFKNCDKKQLLDQESKKLWDDITSGRAVEDPSLLSKFLVLTFADLKKYHYYYWFAFPAFPTPENIAVEEESKSFTERFNDNQTTSFLEAYESKVLPQKLGYFMIKENGDALEIGELKDVKTHIAGKKKLILGISDPCTLEAHPGWPVRNLLTLAAYHWAALCEEIEIVCFRDRSKDGKRDVSHSLVFTVKLPSIQEMKECSKSVGWEKNERQKLGPRMVNLSATMDPARLAESAVDLNLKLMRWRLAPELALEKINQTRCLLLGSGTLGCNIARNLLGWGVRNITLVDNGKVSYSNPVRQTLFIFDDSLGGGKPKAETAAEALKQIFPGVNAQGLSLSIPMPGHSLSDNPSVIEQTKKDVEKLDELISNHDVVFLLMDTRESRWLPTLIGASKRKIVINAALGFDTFLVLRHGLKKDPTVMDTSECKPENASALTSPITGDELGCYFCNDVVAPGNSTRDRTLDQQCTVSRPGMSYMAGALAVELLVSLLQHKDGAMAAADTTAKDEHLTKDLPSTLGLLPHQIRGFLSRFHMLLPACRAFDKCTACSQVVIDAYEKEGFDFLVKAFNLPKYLEDLTGLTKLHEETMNSEVWEMSDDEEF